MSGKNSSKASCTDWERLAQMADTSIDSSDIPEAGEEFFRHAKLSFGGREVTAAEIVTLCLEPRLAAWVRSISPAHSREIKAALARLRKELNPAKNSRIEAAHPRQSAAQVVHALLDISLG
jgi:hypothetical protein